LLVGGSIWALSSRRTTDAAEAISLEDEVEEVVTATEEVVESPEETK
jgi:hypothetical protein